MNNSPRRWIIALTLLTAVGLYLLPLRPLGAQRPLPGAAVSATTAEAATSQARGDSKRGSKLPPDFYQSACGECHLAYAPKHLPAASWERVLAGLDDHFGSDASLAPAELAPVHSYLVSGARKPKDTDPDPAVLRITEARWWLRQHDGIRPQRWNHPRIASRAACESCHLDAASEGRYGRVKIPKAGQP
jgi:cytochrome c5